MSILLQKQKSKLQTISDVITYIEDNLPYKNVWCMFVKKKSDNHFIIRVRVMIDKKGYEYVANINTTELLLTLNDRELILQHFIEHVKTKIKEERLINEKPN